MTSSNSLAGSEMRTSIDSFRNLKLRIMISYDCTGAHKPFGNDLRIFLEDKKGAVRQNESLYLLPESLSETDIDKLARTIKLMFEAVVTEGKYADEGNTKVLFIIPNKQEFKVREVINESGKSNLLKS